MRHQRPRSAQPKEITRLASDEPLLDACLIVRDEEHNLPGCLASLQSLRPLLGRICIYDTGSVDRSVDIAREAGCEVLEGFWDNDFSRARNESLSMSDAEWAIVIDADERVVADAQRLGMALREASLVGANVIDAELYHVDGVGRRIAHSSYIKGVRPSMIRFAHPVHEIASGVNGVQVRISRFQNEDLHFMHLGYATLEMQRAKATRNYALADAALSAALAKGDRVLAIHALHHRGRSAGALGRTADSLDDLERAWRQWGKGSPHWFEYGDELVRRLLMAGQVDRAEAFLDMLEAGGVSSAASLLLRGELLLARGDSCGAGDFADKLIGLDAAGFDPRQALDLRLRAALLNQSTDVALAVALVLVGRGESEHLVTVCDLWRGTAQQLAEVMLPYRAGVHGDDIVRTLASVSGLGAEVAELLVSSGRSAAFDGGR